MTERQSADDLDALLASIPPDIVRSVRALEDLDGLLEWRGGESSGAFTEGEARQIAIAAENARRTRGGGTSAGGPPAPARSAWTTAARQEALR